MNLIPQRLFENKEVKTLLRDGNVCILLKELSESIIQKEGYISNHVISILLAGEQHIQTYEEEHIHIRPGEILFIPRGLYHVTDLLPNGGKFKSVLFYFDDALILEFLSTATVSEFSRELAPPFLKIDSAPSIHTFVQALIQIYQPQKIQNKSFLSLKIQELLHLLNDLMGQQALANFLFRLTLPSKRNIKGFLEKNYDKPLKIEDYAYLTGRSVSTFRRDFKAQFETTPQKWLKEKRMDKALALISQKEISVTQLAYEVGYENISYFIKEFKACVGLSPKQYLLQMHRNRLS